MLFSSPLFVSLGWLVDVSPGDSWAQRTIFAKGSS